MLNIYNNKEAFLRIKPKVGFMAFIFMTIILVLLILFMYNKKVYNNFKTKGIVSCQEICEITTLVPTNINFQELKLNNKMVKFKITNKELTVDEQHYQTYYTITLNVAENLSDKEIVDLIFYYNKQRIITKIKEKMF